VLAKGLGDPTKFARDVKAPQAAAHHMGSGPWRWELRIAPRMRLFDEESVEKNPLFAPEGTGT